MINTPYKVGDVEATAHNDDSDVHKDEVGENTGEDTGLTKATGEKEANVKERSPKEENL